MKLLGKKGRWVLCPVLSLFVLLITACAGGSFTATQPTAMPTEAPVNGFGPRANHVHSLLALPNHVLLLATHYGTYRSEDRGTTWQQVSGGRNQPMQGLMDYSLVMSLLDSQRLYMLTQPAVNPHAGILGLYTSSDQGRTWKLAIPTVHLPSDNIYFVAAGNDTPQQVYVYLPSLGALGLKVSLDAGQHFSSTGTLPFGSILGMLAIPGAPGHLLAYREDGVARSNDHGAHWQTLKGINGVFNMVAAGTHRPIYATGDAGVYVSTDSAASFTLVNTHAAYGSLTVSPAQKDVLYGKTGTAIYRSTDGGHTWTSLPHISGNLAVLTVDPDNASQVYLSLSYPTVVYQLGPSRSVWQSLTPAA